MKHRIASAVVVGALGTALLMCNIWTSLSNCTTDADCPLSERCAPDVQRCVPRQTTGNDGSPSSDVGTDGPSHEASSDGGRNCESLPWGKPKLVRGFEKVEIVDGRLSPDELSMILTKGDQFGHDNTIYTASRRATTDPFQLDGPVPGVNADASAFWPTLTADGLLLFFESSRPNTEKDAGEGIRIWSADRVNKLADFSVPRVQSLFDVPLSAGSFETSPYVHPSGRSLYFASSARQGHGAGDIYIAEIGNLGSVTRIRNIDEVNTEGFENTPLVTLDEKTLYFTRYSTTTPFRVQIWKSTTNVPGGTFSTPVLVPELNSDHDDNPSWVSPDHCRIYIGSSRPTSEDAGLPDSGVLPYHLWVSER